MMSNERGKYIKMTPEEKKKMLVRIEELCSEANSWPELQSKFEASKDEFKGKSWDAVRREVNRGKNRKWIKHFIDVGEISAKEWIEFFSRGRTMDEAVKKFNISQSKAERLLFQKYDGHRLIMQYNVHDEKTFLLLPHDPEEIKTKSRIWTPYLQKEKQPYLIIKFPDELEWKNIKTVPISDSIYGSRHHDADPFDEYVNWISRNPHVFVFLNGDIIAYQKKLASLEQAMIDFKYKISRIAHKILWAQQGDEERNCQRVHGGFDPLKVVCEDFGIPYFEEPVHADILWKKQIFTFFCFHGFTTAQTKGGKINAAIRPLDFQEHTMFTVMSHAEDSIAKEIIRICRDTVNFGLTEKRQHAIICPTFSKYFGTEKARKGYAPPASGTISCNLEPNGKYYISA